MRVNRERLWLKLQEIGGIGRDPQGGISRFAWTPEYRLACQRLMNLAREADLSARMDCVGNIWIRLEGQQPELPAILTGSHFDTVPHGGRFDGLAGIMTALEALMVIKESDQVPVHPIELVAFINEEASQFLGGTFGSKAICGILPADYPLTCCNRHTGQPLREAMLEFDMGLDPDHIEKCVIDPGMYKCFIELHIEQGRYLLDRNYPLAIVNAIAGIQQMYVTLKGESCHAGGMAMKDRHDTLMAASHIACEVENLALHSGGQDTRATVGYIKSHPAEHNIVADRSVLPIDYREENDEIWQDYYEKLEQFIKDECQARGLEYSIQKTIELKPAHAAPEIMETMKIQAENLQIPYLEMVSYPCHDAVNMERIMPMGMIFVRSSNGGLSHCPQEYTTPEDLGDGADLLLSTLIELAK